MPIVNNSFHVFTKNYINTLILSSKTLNTEIKLVKSIQRMFNKISLPNITTPVSSIIEVMKSEPNNNVNSIVDTQINALANSTIKTLLLDARTNGITNNIIN